MNIPMHRIARLIDAKSGAAVGFGPPTYQLPDFDDEDFPMVLGERFCRDQQPASLPRVRTSDKR